MPAICATVSTMSHKSGKVAALTARFAGRGFDARYLGFFDCFNRGQYYEAHDVLEDLWLLDRQGRDGDFYRGLIQLAGAFVLLQKNRPRGTIALLQLAGQNLSKYSDHHGSLDVPGLLALIRSRADHLSRSSEQGPDSAPLPAPWINPPE